MKIDPNTLERDWYHREILDSKYTLQLQLQAWYLMIKDMLFRLTQGIGRLVSVLLRMELSILDWDEGINTTMIKVCLKDAKTLMLGTFNSR